MVCVWIYERKVKKIKFIRVNAKMRLPFYFFCDLQLKHLMQLILCFTIKTQSNIMVSKLNRR